MVGVHIPEGVDAEVVGVGDTAWRAESTPVRSLVHWGASEGGPLVVTLSVANELSIVDLLVVEHHLRPDELLGAGYFQRPDSLIPNAALGSDRIVQRTPVRIHIPPEGQGIADAPPAAEPSPSPSRDK